jgi:hypothetical protein
MSHLASGNPAVCKVGMQHKHTSFSVIIVLIYTSDLSETHLEGKEEVHWLVEGLDKILLD